MRVPARATSGGARKVCRSIERATFTFEGTDRSVDTSHGLHPLPTKELGLPVAYPHKPAPTTPRAHTAECHSRCRPPRAVGHHHRAQRTRRSVQDCTRGGGSVAASPAEAGGGVGRVFLGVDAGGRGRTRVAREVGYQHRRVVLGRVVAGVRRRVPRYRQGGHA